MNDRPDDTNVNYKEMYLKMVRATEAAMRLLIEAQRECEELYIGAEVSSFKEQRKRNI